MLMSRIRHLIHLDQAPTAHSVVLALLTSVVAVVYFYALLIYSYGEIILHGAQSVTRALIQAALNI